MFRLSKIAVGCMIFLCSRSDYLSGADTVYFATEGNSQGWAKISGELVGLSRTGLILRDSSGSLREFRGRPVLRIETELLPEHREGNEAYLAGHFELAQAKFRVAQAKESRPWVAEELIVRRIWCLRYLGRQNEAIEEFASLVRLNPQTALLASIPLAWIPGEISPEVERRSLEALRFPSPELQLLGASYLLGGKNEPQAVQFLTRFSTGGEEPLRSLAWFQLTRTRLWRLTEAEIKQLERGVERLPRDFRPGPTAVVAQAWETRKAYEDALLWWLQLPLSFPEHRDLAAWGLLHAGRNLERLNRLADAAKMYRELLDNYPEFPYGHLAESRLDELPSNR